MILTLPHNVGEQILSTGLIKTTDAQIVLTNLNTRLHKTIYLGFSRDIKFNEYSLDIDGSCSLFESCSDAEDFVKSAHAHVEFIIFHPDNGKLGYGFLAHDQLMTKELSFGHTHDNRVSHSSIGAIVYLIYKSAKVKKVR